MAGIGEFIVAYCAADSTLTGIVGTRVSPWDAIRKTVLPRIVYMIQSGNSVKTLTRPKSLRRTEVTVEAHASTHPVARQIAERLIGDPDTTVRLDGYAGTLGGIVVQGCHLDSEAEQYDEPPSESTGSGVFRVIMTFIVWHKLA